MRSLRHCRDQSDRISRPAWPFERYRLSYRTWSWRVRRLSSVPSIGWVPPLSSILFFLGSSCSWCRVPGLLGEVGCVCLDSGAAWSAAWSSADRWLGPESSQTSIFFPSILFGNSEVHWLAHSVFWRLAAWIFAQDWSDSGTWFLSCSPVDSGDVLASDHFPSCSRQLCSSDSDPLTFTYTFHDSHGSYSCLSHCMKWSLVSALQEWNHSEYIAFTHCTS